MDRRVFLRASGAAFVVSAAPARAAAEEASFAAERASADVLTLRWSGLSDRVALYASSNPAALASQMPPLAIVRNGQSTNARFAAAPRPYFLIEGADGDRLRAAERLLPLEGVRNFRDLGGYRSADGRRTRWGKIYRSAALGGLTPSDFDYLRSLHVTTVCDFRSAQERAGDPTHWQGAGQPEMIFSDYDMAAARRGMPDLRALRDGASAREAFAAGYADYPRLLEPQYRAMFDHLKQERGALLCHCTAGKDRTGMASALVLSVLGVPRETILADYALTGAYTPPARAITNPAVAAQAHAMAQLPDDVTAVFMNSDPRVLEQALAIVDRDFGGPVELVKARFDLSDTDIAHMQRTYLE